MSRPPSRRRASDRQAVRPITRDLTPAREHTGGNFIADAQLAATRHLGAQIAFSNHGGVRADIVPAADGSITFGQLFAMQPFGNNVVVRTLTGAQLKSLLEQQFDSGTNTVARPNMLLPSRGFFFAYDLSRPAGDRIVEMRLENRPIDPQASYKVAVVNFLSSGGDNFTVLTQGQAAIDANLVDVEASESTEAAATCATWPIEIGRRNLAAGLVELAICAVRSPRRSGHRQRRLAHHDVDQIGSKWVEAYDPPHSASAHVP